MDLLTLGESMVSLSAPRGERLKLASTFTKRVCGSESNVSIALARLGYSCGWISCLGKDEFGDYIRFFLRGEGVNIDFVRQSENSPTGILFKSMINSKQISVSYYRQNSAFNDLKADDINEIYFSKVKYVFLSGISISLSENSFKCVERVIELAKKNGIPIIFDLNLRKKLWQEQITKQRYFSIFNKGLDYILAGRSEIEFISEKIGFESNVSFLQEFGCKTVIIKNNHREIKWKNEEKQGSLLGYRVFEVVDPVGAGDAFAGGVISWFIR